MEFGESIHLARYSDTRKLYIDSDSPKAGRRPRPLACHGRGVPSRVRGTMKAAVALGAAPYRLVSNQTWLVPGTTATSCGELLIRAFNDLPVRAIPVLDQRVEDIIGIETAAYGPDIAGGNDRHAAKL